MSIVLIRTAKLLGIIFVASRAFALYYLLQCVVAIIACRHVQKNQHLNIAGSSVLAWILAFVVIFANLAEWSVTHAGMK